MSRFVADETFDMSTDCSLFIDEDSSVNNPLSTNLNPDSRLYLFSYHTPMIQDTSKSKTEQLLDANNHLIDLIEKLDMEKGSLKKDLLINQQQYSKLVTENVKLTTNDYILKAEIYKLQSLQSKLMGEDVKLIDKNYRSQVQISNLNAQVLSLKDENLRLTVQLSDALQAGVIVNSRSKSYHPPYLTDRPKDTSLIGLSTSHYQLQESFFRPRSTGKQ